MVKWIRSKVSKRDEPTGKQCTACLGQIGGATEEELFFAGGVFLIGVGWFCGPRCENKYRLRFRIQGRPSSETAVARRPSGPSPAVATAAAPLDSEQEPTAEEVAEVLRARRRRMSSGG